MPRILGLIPAPHKLKGRIRKKTCLRSSSIVQQVLEQPEQPKFPVSKAMQKHIHNRTDLKLAPTTDVAWILFVCMTLFPQDQYLFFFVTICYLYREILLAKPPSPTPTTAPLLVTSVQQHVLVCIRKGTVKSSNVSNKKLTSQQSQASDLGPSKQTRWCCGNLGARNPGKQYKNSVLSG